MGQVRQPGHHHCTIITEPAVERPEHIRDGMPLILEERAHNASLSGDAQAPTPSASCWETNSNFFRVGREFNNSWYEGTDTKKRLISPV